MATRAPPPLPRTPTEKESFFQLAGHHKRQRTTRTRRHTTNNPPSNPLPPYHSASKILFPPTAAVIPRAAVSTPPPTGANPPLPRPGIKIASGDDLSLLLSERKRHEPKTSCVKSVCLQPASNTIQSGVRGGATSLSGCKSPQKGESQNRSSEMEISVDPVRGRHRTQTPPRPPVVIPPPPPPLRTVAGCCRRRLLLAVVVIITTLHPPPPSPSSTSNSISCCHPLDTRPPRYPMHAAVCGCCCREVRHRVYRTVLHPTAMPLLSPHVPRVGVGVVAGSILGLCLRFLFRFDLEVFVPDPVVRGADKSAATTGNRSSSGIRRNIGGNRQRQK